MNGYCLSNQNHRIYQIRPEVTAHELMCEADDLLYQAKGMAYVLNGLGDEGVPDHCLPGATWALAEMLDRLDAVLKAERDHKAKEKEKAKLSAPSTDEQMEENCQSIKRCVTALESVLEESKADLISAESLLEKRRGSSESRAEHVKNAKLAIKEYAGDFKELQSRIKGAKEMYGGHVDTKTRLVLEELAEDIKSAVVLAEAHANLQGCQEASA